ncbi:PREDICTED: dnaJ homolog subfamily C member 4-like [Dufourea novaeangliae]|uniref:dnaJ homolog subfamily C member 4-like n=1 Tax=Dufourea novaeangliae TaxID=178035 RepID=UPI000767B869|nr:PREDICTED: dnaJ homolog subfamily C member 4-like [Dufourea novaeangliae]
MFRIYKFEIPVVIRHYGNYCYRQRAQCNHYDTLRISPNATEREIKNAYIKLSKKMHPDNSSEGNHADFVKINEAYTILSKKHTRRDYDMSLKHYYPYTHHPFRQHNGNDTWRPNPTYADWGFKEYSTNHKYDPVYLRKAVIYCIIFIIIGTVLQILIIERYLVINRIEIIRRSMKYQLEYERIKAEAEGKTVEEQLKNIMESKNNHESTFWSK